MSTCFLFTKYLNQDGCLSLCLTTEGKLEAPLEHRSFEELQALQVNNKIIIVEPCDQASILTVELPWLNEKKARTAIPYALEDELAQSIDSLHFAFDRKHYSNNRYLVAVIDRQKLQALIEQLKSHEINPGFITLDWFALQDNEMAYTDDYVLVNQTDFKGALSTGLVDTFLAEPAEITSYLFNPSKTSINNPNSKTIETSSFNWLAERLMSAEPMNLCQGNMEQDNQKQPLFNKGKCLIALASIWVVTLILTNMIDIHLLNKQMQSLDQQTAVLYKKFFPDAKRVISPKFRISQLLGDDSNSSKSDFLPLLNKLSQVMVNSNANIEQINYQNNRLSVTLACADFSTLEQLENRLKQRSLKVNQTQAATRDQQVIATLELT